MNKVSIKPFASRTGKGAYAHASSLHLVAPPEEFFSVEEHFQEGKRACGVRIGAIGPDFARYLSRKETHVPRRSFRLEVIPDNPILAAGFALGLIQTQMPRRVSADNSCAHFRFLLGCSQESMHCGGLLPFPCQQVALVVLDGDGQPGVMLGMPNGLSWDLDADDAWVPRKILPGCRFFVSPD